MPLIVLVSSDANLQLELEGCFGGFSPRPSLIQTESLKEFEEVLKSVTELDAVFLDVATIQPPKSFSWPLILIGEDPESSYPSVQRPLYPETLSYMLEEVIASSAKKSATRDQGDSAQVEFIHSFLKEVVHDLNNQFTTLRGNVPFLLEMYPQDDGTIQDIRLATERGADLLHLLEGLDSDTRPDPVTFLFKDLYKELSHFGKKMVPICQFNGIPSEIACTSLRGDPLLLCSLLLRILWTYGSCSTSISLQQNLLTETLEISFHPVVAEESSEGLISRLQTILAIRTPGRISLDLDGRNLICSLPRNLSL